MREIITKIEKGDPLSNKELALALDFYGKLTDMLLECGLRYALVRRDAQEKLTTLEGFHRARFPGKPYRESVSGGL